MQVITAILAGLGLLASAIWIGFFIVAGINRDRMRRLIDLPPDEPPDGWPTLALIFAARDEADTVEDGARSMLAIDYPALKVVAVDDRSRDDTGAILDRISGEDPRLEVVHVRELPEGWLGKTNALQSAAAAIEADFLLFTDADVIFAPDALRRAVSFAVREGADHLTVAPEVPTQTVGERLFLAMFQVGLTIGFPGWEVENPSKRTHLGIGAFNLVRTSAFRDIGGFERLALSVDDDIQLGRSIKWAGYRSRVVLGAGLISVRWHIGLAGMIRGLEKNFFAGARFRLGLVARYALSMLLVGVMPHVGLLVGPAWSRAVCGLGVATACTLVALIGGQSRIAWYYGLTMPISAVVCVFALLRSTWITLARGGVVWRGHHYPLSILREHVRRRERWLAELWASTR